MTRSLVVVVLFASVAFFTACNPYSREDLLFAMVSPGAEELRLAPPGTSASDDTSDVASGDGTSQVEQAMASTCAPTNLRCHAIGIATSFNQLTTSILGLVDRVLAEPPTFRQKIDGNTRRVWGPFVADQLTLRVEMIRTPDNIYVICLHGAPGVLSRRPTPEEFTCGTEPSTFGLTPLLEGIFAPGPISNARAQNGKGAIVFHAAALGDVDADVAQLGEVAFAYDNTGDEKLIAVTVRDAGVDGDAIDSDYFYENNDDTGAGSFYYALRQDFTPGVFGAGFQREELLSIAQWNGEKAGRVDAVVRGGDLGDFQYNAVHCWDEDFLTLFFFDDDDAHPTIGEIGDCLFDVPPPVPEFEPLFE